MSGGADAGVSVVAMRRRHLRAVLRIERRSQPVGWSLGLFLAELGRPADRAYRVAVLDGAVVGFGGLLLAGADAHVTTLAVDPDHRRRGVATALLADLASAARRGGAEHLTLEVRASNVAAVALYRRFGLAPAGVRRRYYRDPEEDALVMWAHDIDTDDYGDRLAALAAGADRREPSGAQR